MTKPRFFYIKPMIDLKDKHDCCGCSACMAVCPTDCISMREDGEGFLYPVTDSGKCINCGLCAKVCPVIHPGPARKPLQCYASRITDPDRLEECASGGAFQAIATKILGKGGAVFGSRFDARHEAVHDMADNAKDMDAFTGSKYIQSRMEDNFRRVKEILKTGRPVLFTGTPCQVAGLNGFLRHGYENLLTVDLICHGVPSPGVWRKYIEEEGDLFRHGRGKENARMERIRFRDKRNAGWNGYNFTIEFSTGPEESPQPVIFSEPGKANNLFIKGFLADFYSRPSCYRCPAREFRSGSDITIGDFWGIEKFMHDFDDNKGVSAVLVNTEKGLSFWKSADAVRLPATYGQIADYNKCLEKSVPENDARKRFFEEGPDNIHERISKFLNCREK